MSHSKFNKSFLVATLATLSVIVGVQGCSSSDEQAEPTAGSSGRASGGRSNGGAAGQGTAGTPDGEAGVEETGGTANVGGGNGSAGNDNGGRSSGGDAGTSTDPDPGAAGTAGAAEAAGAAGAANPTEDCDGFLRPCGGLACQQDFDNGTLTKLSNGMLPALP